jgi:diphthine synthase
VGGDPLIATTHKILFLEARKQGVKFAAIHSTSIFSTAIGESGLDFYKFGKTFTIPSWSEHYRPISFYETLKKNQSICAHSVALLDFDQSKGVSMPISDALAELEAAEAHYKDGIISPGKKIFIMANLCGSGEIKDYITFADAKQKQYGSAPALIIIPAQLSDIEEEIVRSMYGN